VFKLINIFKRRTKTSALNNYRKKYPITIAPLSSQQRSEIEEFRDKGQTNIVMYNDDSTPFEFVMELLEQYLQYDTEKAAMLAGHIHKSGSFIIYRSNQTFSDKLCKLLNQTAQDHGHKLSCQTQEG
jgi:ATP-dependent Clp protease adapter protein ClpS